MYMHNPETPTTPPNNFHSEILDLFHLINYDHIIVLSSTLYLYSEDIRMSTELDKGLHMVAKSG